MRTAADMLGAVIGRMAFNLLAHDEADLYDAQGQYTSEFLRDLVRAVHAVRTRCACCARGATPRCPARAFPCGVWMVALLLRTGHTQASQRDVCGNRLVLDCYQERKSIAHNLAYYVMCDLRNITP